MINMDGILQESETWREPGFIPGCLAVYVWLICLAFCVVSIVLNIVLNVACVSGLFILDCPFDFV